MLLYVMLLVADEPFVHLVALALCAQTLVSNEWSKSWLSGVVRRLDEPQ